MVVDDLSKEPTMDQLLHRDAKQFDLSTPISMIDNGSNIFLEITNRLNSLERVIAGMAKDPRLVRCLEGEYGITPQKDGPSMDEAEDATKSFAASENQKKRRNRK